MYHSGYVEAKVQLLGLCRSLYYRTKDYFGYPRINLNWAEIEDVSAQPVEQFSGRLENMPMTVTNTFIVDQCLKTFHFDSENAVVIDSTDKLC